MHRNISGRVFRTCIDTSLRERSEPGVERALRTCIEQSLRER